MAHQAQQPSAPARRLGLGAAVALTVGNIVGVGIFLTPSAVADASSSTGLYVAFWILGALIALAGALTTAELGSMFPRGGGDYVFLSEAFGRPVAYAWGWLSVAATFSGSIAALAVGTMETLGTFASSAQDVSVVIGPLTISWKQLAAVGLVWGVTAMHCRSVRLVGHLQLVLTWAPISIFLGAIVWYLVAGERVPAVAETNVVVSSFEPGLASAAFCAVFFTYSGWNVLTYIGGEVKRPARTIPVAIIVALVAVAVIYLVLNVAFLEALPLSEIAHEPNVGVAAASRLFGPVGAEVFAGLLTCSLVAGLNVTAMAGSRIALAMAGDGYLAGSMARLHRRHGTPVVALLVQAGWSTVLVLTGGFEALVTFTGAVMILLGCATISTIFVFRRRRVPSRYRTPLYPVAPVFFIVVGVTVLALGAAAQWFHLLLGVGAFVVLVVRGRAVARRLASAQTPVAPATASVEPGGRVRAHHE